MRRVTFFTKRDCTLCRAALYVIERVRKQIPFELDTVDITAPGQEAWFECYRHHIPVIHLDGNEVFRHRVDERLLRERLAASSGKSSP